MKIKIIYTTTSNYIGGSEKTLLFILDYLRDNIFPQVIIPNSGPLEEELKIRGVRYYILKKYSKFSLFYLIRLFFIYKNSYAQILHHFSSRIDAIPAKLLGIKIIETNNLSRNNPNFFLNKIAFIDYLTAFLVDSIMSASEYIKKQLVERNIPPDKIQVIYNGVDFNKFYPLKPLSPQRKKVILGIFARLHPIKGHKELFQAIKILKDQGYSTILLVIGEGKLRKHLESLTDCLKLRKEIKFLGFKSALNKYYNLCDMVVLPSYSEAFPNVILEAMAVRKPIIATSVGGNKEALTHRYNGYLIEPQNPKQIADAIIELLKNPKLQSQIATNAFINVRNNFTMNEMMKKINNLYLDVLDAR